MLVESVGTFLYGTFCMAEFMAHPEFGVMVITGIWSDGY